MNIDALRKGILKTLQTEYQWPISEECTNNVFGAEAKKVIENYVVSCFLLGNDFLPNVTSLHLKKNGLASILFSFQQAWTSMGHPLILDTESPNESFSMEFMVSWMEHLSKQEDDWFWKMNEEYMKKRCMIRDEEDKVEFYPILPEHKSPLAFEIVKYGNPQKWRGLYYKHLMDCERQDMTIMVNACTEYVKGILWTYRYYKQYSKPASWYYPFG